ncbi:MAG: peptidoglycan glycosyltransferase [Agathobacter sp.]|nr:peptidoglycan glycosyltransferase [Agathobacter sp.]
MKSKLLVIFMLFAVVLCGLIVKLMYIEYTSGEKYEKIVLAQQSYGSTTIPFKRGDIVDSNGTVLATSIAVYNVILDCSVMTSDEEYITPTIDALVSCFPDLDRADLEKYATEQKDSKYIILAKKLPYEDIQDFVEMQEARDEKNKLVNPNIKGVWFEKEYQRYYPYNELAASVIGFTSAGNVGTIGLENYYDDILNGINGREYGYLNSDSVYEKNIISAQDGKTLVTTIDMNIQSIVEEKIKEFNETYRDNYREGEAGSANTAVVVMNPQNGEVLAMADYPEFNLNSPRDLTSLYTEEQISQFTDEETMDILNGLWQNYCVSSTYEPGSVQKPFTIAAGLETGTLSVDNTYVCDGYEMISGQKIRCVNRNGHGEETLEKSLMDSCNDALMQMSYSIGASNFLDFQSIFGFGQKTGIDLPGEANTSALVFTESNIRDLDLATNAFGQNYNCTMIQMVSAFSSLINGGTYYQPHVVKKVTDSNGNTISTSESLEIKQTVSQETSDTIRSYLYSTVTSGTGKTAKVDGYSMGGKTGTAQKLPRAEGNYLVSFMGFAPYDDPQLVIYCIVDVPNAEDQAHSYYAMNIVREILEEVLPYMNIYPDEELTGANKDLGITGTDVLEKDKNNNGESPSGATEGTTGDTAQGATEGTTGDTSQGAAEGTTGDTAQGATEGTTGDTAQGAAEDGVTSGEAIPPE